MTRAFTASLRFGLGLQTGSCDEACERSESATTATVSDNKMICIALLTIDLHADTRSDRRLVVCSKSFPFRRALVKGSTREARRCSFARSLHLRRRCAM